MKTPDFQVNIRMKPEQFEVVQAEATERWGGSVPALMREAAQTYIALRVAYGAEFEAFLARALAGQPTEAVR